MPHLSAPETPDNLSPVWVIVMEDRHLHSSPGARWEQDYGPDDSGCFNKGGADEGVAGPYRDWVGKAEVAVQLLVYVANLQPLFSEVELSLDGHKFLHDLHNPPLSILHQPLQHILEVAQTPITINFPMLLGVINLGEHHVDGKFPLIPVPRVPPLERGHGGMSGDPPVDLDGAGTGLSPFASASGDHSVISRIFDVEGHDEPFMSPIPFMVEGFLM